LGGGKGQLKVVVLYGWRKRRERQHYDRNYEIILNFNNLWTDRWKLLQIQGDY